MECGRRHRQQQPPDADRVLGDDERREDEERVQFQVGRVDGGVEAVRLDDVDAGHHEDDERELSKAKASEGTKRKDGALVLRTTTDYVNKQITTTNAQKTKEGKNTDAIGQQQASSSFKEAINIM